MENERKRVRSSNGDQSDLRVRKVTRFGSANFASDGINVPPNYEDDFVFELSINESLNQTRFRIEGIKRRCLNLQHGFRPMGYLTNQEVDLSAFVSTEQEKTYIFELSRSLPIFKSGRVIFINKVQEFNHLARLV